MAAPAAPPAAALSSFSAVPDDNTVIPPDTNGAVGPSHVMAALNNTIRIQDRFGTTLSSVSLRAFWAGYFTTEVFDPRVRYDPFAGRWIFAVAADSSSPNSAILTAVSQTGDPTGLWTRAKAMVDPGGTTFGDYTDLGFNHNWIVVTVNLFTISGSTPTGSKIVIFDKAGFYAGNPGTPGVKVDPNGFAQVPALTYDNSLPSLNLVEEFNGSKQQLRISTISGPVGAESYATDLIATVPLGPWAETTPTVTGGFAPQAGTLTKIDAGDARMQTVVYRNGALWAAHTVFLPVTLPSRAAVQWVQLTPAGAVTQASRIDDPSGAQFYAYPSVAVNAGGDMGIGYAHFSGAQYASGEYASRAFSDAANTLRAATVVQAGAAPYSKLDGSGINRWGDYSTTVVDPADDASIWTIQEYAASAPTAGASRWGTWWARFGAPGQTETTLAAVVGGDNALYYRISDQAFQGLGGFLIAAPAVVSVPKPGGAPFPLFIGLGSDHRYYVRSLGAGWQDLLPGLPVGCYDNPSAVVTGSGPYQLTVTCVGGDRALYYWQTSVAANELPVITSGSPVHALGGGLLAGAAVAPVNGALTFFAEGGDHVIYVNTGAGYTSINAACNGHPAAAARGPDALVACQGLDGALYYSKNTAGTGWAPFRAAGGLLIDGPGIAYLTTGPTIFVEGRDGALYHLLVSPAGDASSAFVRDGGGLLYGAAATAL